VSKDEIHGMYGNFSLKFHLELNFKENAVQNKFCTAFCILFFLYLCYDVSIVVFTAIVCKTGGGTPPKGEYQL